LADGNGAEHFAGVAVDERHELVVAANDEDFVSGVNGEPRGRLARSEGPGILDFESLGVEFDEGTFVFEIDEDFALAVGGAKLWAATERKSAAELSGSGVDGRGSVGITIEGKNALRERIIDDRVRIFVGLPRVVFKKVLRRPLDLAALNRH
jgi:hypothetical protein